MTTPFDVAIVGGGPAGLTAAGTLARQLHTAVVFDSGEYRNGASPYLHTVPGWEHKSPAEFRATARAQIADNYDTIRFEDISIVTVAKNNDSLFVLTDARGSEWQAKKLLLAMGSANVFPDLAGYSEAWGQRIFHCLFCLGYEDRGAPSAGVLAIQGSGMAALAVHMADNAAQLAKEVTIYTNASSELDAQLKPLEAITPFKIDSRPIVGLEPAADSIGIRFADGSSSSPSFIVHNPLTRPNGPFASQLGLKLTPMGDIDAAAPYYQTSVRGVFAVGDGVTPYKVVPHAIASGNFGAVAAAAQLQAEKYGHPSPF